MDGCRTTQQPPSSALVFPQLCLSLGNSPQVRAEPWMVTDGGCRVALEAGTTRTSHQAPPKLVWRATDTRARCALVPPPNPLRRPHQPPLPGARTLKAEWLGKCLHPTARKGGSELRPFVSNFIIGISNIYNTEQYSPLGASGHPPAFSKPKVASPPSPHSRVIGFVKQIPRGISFHLPVSQFATQKYKFSLSGDIALLGAHRTMVPLVRALPGCPVSGF